MSVCVFFSKGFLTFKQVSPCFTQCGFGNIFWTILVLDIYGPHTAFCPDLLWLPAYLHIKCGKLTTGHPWNLQSIVHGSNPFVLMTFSTFGCSLVMPQQSICLDIFYFLRLFSHTNCSKSNLWRHPQMSLPTNINSMHLCTQNLQPVLFIS